MSTIGMQVKYLSDEEAEDIVNNNNEWKKTQPVYIAVEMTNADITRFMQEFLSYAKYKSADCRNLFECLITGKPYEVLDYEYHEIVRAHHGKLYKKILNPYMQGKDVIPWE